MRRTRWFFSIALAVGMLAALVTPAGARPPDVIRCGSDDPNNPEVIEYTTVNADVVVDGFCQLGAQALVNGDVRVGPGSGLAMGADVAFPDSPTINGNLTVNRGFAGDMKGGTVTGNVEIKNARKDRPGEVLFGGGVFIAWIEIGGDLTLKNIESYLVIGACKPPQFGACGPNPGDEVYFTIGGNVNITNSKGIPWPGVPDANTFYDYTVGGDMSLKNIDGSGRLTGNLIGGDLTCKNVDQLDTWVVSANTAGGTDSCQPG